MTQTKNKNCKKRQTFFSNFFIFLQKKGKFLWMSKKKMVVNGCPNFFFFMVVKNYGCVCVLSKKKIKRRCFWDVESGGQYMLEGGIQI